MVIKVNALDPGVTTGYATGIIENGSMGVVSGQSKWNELQLYNNLKFSKPDIIVYERFEYRSKKAYNVDNVDLFPRNLIGVINLYVQEMGGSVKLYTQFPGYALGKSAFFSDQKLKSVGAYKVANPHANDAMRHLLQWFTTGPGFKFNTNGFEPLA